MNLLSNSSSIPRAISFKLMFDLCSESQMENELPIILGINKHGVVESFDLTKAPHILIGGATGSGKTIFLWTVLTSLLLQKKSEDIRFIIVDPKRVDMAPFFNNLPHLLTSVITDVEKAAAALRWTIHEMEHRYKKLTQAKVRNISQYNKINEKNKLPYIVFVIDELADLMILNKKEIEPQIIKLTQMSCAVGIHLVIASQLLSRDVITGLIQANIPTHIAFRVSSKHDSKIILGMSGAELLEKPGDMLFLSSDITTPTHIHAPFISEVEVLSVIQWVIKNQPKKNDDSQSKFITDDYKTDDKSKDTLFNEAVEIIQQHDYASASLIQRRLAIGYARAARLLDQLEENGYIGPAIGSKPRKVINKIK